MNVLVLMYFPVHVGVSVCVNVSKDFGVYFRGESRMAEEELLLCQVLLIVHGGDAVFVWAGGDGGGGHAASFPLSIRRPVGALHRLGGGGAGRGAVFSALAEPEQRSTEDQDYSRGDADDDGPRQRVVSWREDGRDGRFCVCGRMLFTIWLKKKKDLHTNLKMFTSELEGSHLAGR